MAKTSAAKTSDLPVTLTPSPSSRILSRPDVLDYLAELIRTGELNVHDVAADELPRLAVVDRRVLCNGVSLDLARRPMMLRLFRAFCAAPNGRLTRDLLLKQLYNLGEDDRRSPRFKEAMYQNAVKLISRTRAMAQALLGRAAGDVEWMRFDAESHAWDLMVRRVDGQADVPKP